MDPASILLIIVAAWLITYRTGVGTYCAITGKQTPWEKSREARAARRGERPPTDPNRTARGFFARLYGDLWEDLGRWREESRARRMNGERPRTFREWLGDVAGLARGLWPNRRTARPTGVDEGEDLDYYGQKIRPPDEVPDLDTVTIDEDLTPAGDLVPAVTAPEPAPNPVPLPAEKDGNDRPATITGPLTDPPGLDPWMDPWDPSLNHKEPVEPTDDDNLRDDYHSTELEVPDTAPELATVTTSAAANTTSGSRSHLRAVPSPPAPTTDPEPAVAGPVNQNSTSNGGTTMTDAPAGVEIATVGTLTRFGEDVANVCSAAWPAKVEEALNAAGTAGFTNDPAITTALSSMNEHLAALAGDGAALVAAAAAHKPAEEAVSGLGSRAANTTAAYQQQ